MSMIMMEEAHAEPVAGITTRLWRTVLLEGQSLLRDLLGKTIRADERYKLLAELDDVHAAREACFRLIPDLLIADVRLGQSDALPLLEYVCSRLCGTRVLVLSQWTDPLTLCRLREIGIHGFVEKDQSLEILEEAMAEVASGKTYFTAVWGRIHEKLRSDPTAVDKFLSVREVEILRLVSEGLTSKAIASHLGLSLRSVETYRYRMMRKLRVESMAGLIEYGMRMKYGAPNLLR